MMTIKIVDTIINIDLINEKEFVSLEKYKVNNEEPKYIIKSKVDMIKLPGASIFLSTKYYDIVYYDGKKIQLQKDIDSNYIGAIIYDEYNIELIMFGNDFEIEYLLSQYAFVYILGREKNTMFIHGSSVVYKEKAILFTAKSGTGKSTHRRLWEKLGNAVALNDDKNVIVNKDDTLYLYPNPWSGKHHIDNNIIAPLGAIIILYQSKDNVVKRITPSEAIKYLLGQFIQPDVENLDNWNKMLDKTLEMPIYLYGVNMEDDAFYKAESFLKEDKVWE